MDDFNSTSVRVVIDPGETTAIVSIPIIDDDLLEETEFFDVVIEIGGTSTDGVAVREPGIAQVIIASEDG